MSDIPSLYGTKWSTNMETDSDWGPSSVDNKMIEIAESAIDFSDEEEQEQAGQASAVKGTPPRRLGINTIRGSVVISSKDDFASSKPIGFQNLSSTWNRTQTRKGNKHQWKEEANRIGCCFCKKNFSLSAFYLTHMLRDPATNAVLCPILRKHICEICGATGDIAHTRHFCPIRKGNRG